MKLATRAREIEAARLLIFRAAAMKDANQQQIGVYSTQAKLFVSETANRVCAVTIQIHGGNGYSRNYNVEKYYRDASTKATYEGTPRNAKNHHFTRGFEGLKVSCVKIFLMNLDKFKKQLDEICQQNNVAMLGVFGSVARGEDTPESDVDLLIKLKEPVGFIEFIQLEDKFVEIFGRKVDLATEQSLHPLIRQNVLNDLKVLYES